MLPDLRQDGVRKRSQLNDGKINDGLLPVLGGTDGDQELKKALKKNAELGT